MTEGFVSSLSKQQKATYTSSLFKPIPSRNFIFFLDVLYPFFKISIQYGIKYYF